MRKVYIIEDKIYPVSVKSYVERYYIGLEGIAFTELVQRSGQYFDFDQAADIERLQFAVDIFSLSPDKDGILTCHVNEFRTLSLAVILNNYLGKVIARIPSSISNVHNINLTDTRLSLEKSNVSVIDSELDYFMCLDLALEGLADKK